MLATVGGGAATVVASPRRIAVEGPAASVRVYVPALYGPELLVNGARVSATRCGDDLVWPTTAC